MKKSASVVLASLRGSRYGLGKRLFLQAMGRSGENRLRFASLLAVALLDGLFDSPVLDHELGSDVSQLSIQILFR